MHLHQDQLSQAHALRASILAAPDVWLPRRAILLEWLDDFLQRAAAATYELLPGDAADLDALDRFLRKQKVPIT